MNAPTAARVFEAHARPDFRERVQALVGSTTFRDGQMGGRPDHMPAAHAVAATMAMVKRGPQDIGPDIAVAMALGTDNKRALIVALLARAMRMDRRALARRNKGTMGYIANAAFDIIVHGRRRPRLDAITPDDWDLLLPAACRILEALADAALAEAEARWRRRG